MKSRLDSDPLISLLFRQTLRVMIIAELASSLATMLDGIIIAHFFSEYAVASYGLTTPYTNMLKMVGGFFATGTHVVYSKYAARGEFKEGNEVFSSSAIILAALGGVVAIFIFAFSNRISLFLGAAADPEHLLGNTSDYLKGLAFGFPLNLGVLFLMPMMNIDGDKKRIAYAINVMLVVNLAGDLIVAFFFTGSMFGLALATSFSYLYSFAVLLLHFRRGSSIRLSMKGDHLRNFVAVAKSGIIPAITRSFSMVRSYLINMLFITLAGAEFLAANTLVQSNIKAVPICIAPAIGTTTLSIAGVIYGECDRRGLRQIFRTVVSISFGPCLLIAAAVFVFAPQVVQIFGANEFGETTVVALRCFILGLPFIGVKMFFIYYFQSAQKKLLSYYSSFAGELFFLVSSAFLLERLLGDIGLFIAYPVSEFLYVLSIYLVAWIRNRRFPSRLDDILFLGKEFEVDPARIVDVSIGRIEEAQALSKDAMQFCLDNGIDRRTSMYVSLVVEEMAGNIFRHGANDGKQHFVDMKIILPDQDTVKFRLRDNCRPFNPKERAELLNDDPKHNFGLRIVSKISKSMLYANLFNMNQLSIEIDSSLNDLSRASSRIS